jgi:hypothetical protein
MLAAVISRQQQMSYTLDIGRQAARYLLHELLHKRRVVPAIQHSDVQQLWHIQQPLIIEQRRLLLPLRASWLNSDPEKQ